MVHRARAEPPPLVFVRVDDNKDNFGQLFLTGPFLSLCAETEKNVATKITWRDSSRLSALYFNKN